MCFIHKIAFAMDAPNQPSNFKFPKRTFGVKNPEKRSFNAQWFKIHPWIHFDEVSSCTFYIFIETGLFGMCSVIENSAWAVVVKAANRIQT